MKNFSFGKWIKAEKWGVIVIIAAVIVFVALRINLKEKSEDIPIEGGYVEYEKGVVEEILTDTTVQDEASDGGWRGEQMMTVKVKSG